MKGDGALGDDLRSAEEAPFAHATMSPSSQLEGSVSRSKNGPLTLAALGIVYGDIGTSPLYALRECFHGPLALPATTANVLGVLSLIFWALLLVISVKYLTFVMRADNDGEGGIIALMVLALSKLDSARWRWQVFVLGLFGAGLLYGDGIITPAISVLSAVEGLSIAAPALHALVRPISIGILIALFMLQRRGTTRVGRLFGPVMLVWFVTLAILGITAIARHPQVLCALSPQYAVHFFLQNRLSGFFILGVVFLVVTGGEALYADLGHFGLQPIRLAWFTIVLPSLLLNYFGQGSLLIAEPAAVAHPFYHLAPDWLTYPLVALATMATVIASQAVITGAFSLAYQAVQLGLSPRMPIIHTSKDERGQVYVPPVNMALLLAVVGLMMVFRSSSDLAAAYGMAVTTTMVITTLLLYLVARHCWNWSVPRAASLLGFFLVIDLAFFGANLFKVAAGGWIPLLIGVAVCILMMTWKRGCDTLAANLHPWVVDKEPLSAIQSVTSPLHEVDVPAVYLTSSTTGVPLALVRNLQTSRVLHQPLAILSIVTENRPYVPLDQRFESNSLGQEMYRIVARYGFKQNPNVPNILDQFSQQRPGFAGPETTYFLGRLTLEPTRKGGMPYWQKRLFIGMRRLAWDASKYYGIPSDQVVEIGSRMEI